MEALRSVPEGSGRLLLVTGPAGTGKTRRAAAVADRAREDGSTVVWVAGSRPGAPPFWPWHQVLRSLPGPAAAEDVLPGRSRDDPADAAGDGGAGGFGGRTADLRARFELFERVREVLGAAARSGPLAVVLDDLHEADAASLLLLQHLAAGLPGLPLLVVATVRTDVTPRTPEWPAVWADLVRHGEVLPVAPLGEAEVAALLTDATGAADPDLVRRIVERTGGNALFVTELVRWCAGTGEVDALPDTVRAVIAARLAERSPSCRRVLSAAATTGPRAPVDLVADVLGEARDDVLAAVEEARTHGLLEETGTDRVAFIHEIVRDAVYDAQPPAHRTHWHRVVAELLAASGDAAGAAHHYRLGGPEVRGDAGAWFARAGEESLGALAYEEAATQLAAALECDPADPGRVHLRLGTALLAVGDTAGARRAHLAAVDLGREAGDASVVAAAALGLGSGPAGFEVPLFDREQLGALEDALALVGDTDPALRAALLARLATASTYASDEARRRELATEAVALARDSEDDAAVAVALAAYVDLVAGPAHVDERLALTSEIVDRARRLRDSSLELLGLRQRIVARLERGDADGAAADVRDYRSVAAALGQPVYAWYVPLWTAALAFARGDLEEAAAAVDEAERVGARAGSSNAQVLVTSHRWSAAAELADPGSMRAAVEGIEFDEGMGPWVNIAKGFMHATCGEVSAARAALDASVSRLPELPLDSEWLPAVTQAAEAVQLVGGHPVAGWLYEALLPHADLFVVEGIGALLRGSVERHLGGLAALLGDRTAADGHFERAEAANRRTGARLLVARTLYDAATSLGDGTRLAEARSLYADMGVTRRLGRGASGIPASPPEHLPDNEFRQDGETWALAYTGRRTTVRDGKGLHDLAVLLARPGQPVPAVELVAGPGSGRPTAGDEVATSEDLHGSGDLGDLIDAQARREYRQRLAQLEEDAAEADAMGDVAASVRIATERDALVEQLTAAYGLGGRPRRAGDPAERARSTVTARIRDSIRRIAAVHPELGRHLTASVRTGTLCSYEPEQPVTWRLTP
jgi:tetratricopeptide (TPR) repeat protein